MTAMLLAAPTTAQLVAIAAVSALGGAVNSIAGGGTLLTFPALLGLGVPALSANATSTVALWPGSISSMVGYRKELKGARRWAISLAVPSVVGGAAGATLLLITPEARFKALVPWLVLGATVLFALQGPFMRWLRRREEVRREERRRLHESGVGVFEDHELAQQIEPSYGMLAAQFVVGTYGGYFGAGAGIVMLAVFGLMGLTNIHQMNGLKNFNGICFNGIAAITFAFMKIVNWPVALVMAAGSSAGGYMMSGLAQKVPQAWVRNSVTLIGFGSAIWLFTLHS